jgi:triosephosphate isomerase
MKKIVIGNLKMNILSSLERERYFKSFKKELKAKKFEKTEIVLCPSAVHLESFSKALGKKVKIGALNMFWERQGSYTGEVSPAMIKNFGGEYVVLGHSERRRYLHESDHDVNLKILAALKNGLKPILCVGEERQKENSAVIIDQLNNCLEGVSGAMMENVVLCYEPVWAISSNNPDHMPTTNEVMGARLLIKKVLVGKFGNKIVDRVRIIYGGSVDAKNVNEVCIEAEMDGVLVGKESLTPKALVKIAEKIDGNF